MRLLSNFSSRQSWVAPLVCAFLALPMAQASAQNTADATNAPSKAQTQSKQKAAAANKTTATTTKKSTTTKSTKSAAVKPSTAPRIRQTLVAPASKASMGAVRSNVVFVQDLASNAVVFSRNDENVRPIASISKLMTAVIIVDANQPMQEMLEITQDDVDMLKHSRSRLAVGARLSRSDMLHVALMSSENRAANALARNYPGGLPAFVAAMNAKAKQLGMMQSHFVEPTGLSSDNVSTPRDLVKLLQAAASRPAISQFTTDDQQEVRAGKRAPTIFRNTNALVANPSWDIKVSKTGFINEAGQCLVMVAHINNRDVAIVLLNAEGKGTRIGDAMKIKQLLLSQQVAAL
jgi:D-alanyl-D-alanine endopeptidase (penicillin-binding protein 7)